MMIKKIAFLFLVFFSINSFASMDLTCVGTEPFWQIDITSSNHILLMIPDVTNESFSILQTTPAAGGNGKIAFQLSGKNTQSDLLKLNIIKAECDIGMSEECYPFNILVEYHNRILYGCCK